MYDLINLVNSSNNTNDLYNHQMNISIEYYYNKQIEQTPSRIVSLLGAIIAFLFILIGILGDSLIIISIITKKELRNNLINIFIVSLQLNDIFNIGFNQFLVGLSYSFMGWKGPYIICEIFVYTSIICTGSLLWHHALISIHRYLVVVCNLNLKHFGISSKFYVIISIIIARLIPILVCLPAFINKNMTVYSKAALRCMLAPNVSGFQNLLIVIINMLIPCLIVIVSFIYIFARVHSVSKTIRGQQQIKIKAKKKIKNNKQISTITTRTTSISLNNNTNTNKMTKSKNSLDTTMYTKLNTINNNSKSSFELRKELVPAITLQNENNNNINQNNQNNHAIIFSSSIGNHMNREIQITKMFFIIFMVFLFGYLPYGIIRLIDAKNSLHPDVYVLLTVLFIISISISPVIYGLMNNQIRLQCTLVLHKLISCQFNFTSSSSSSTSSSSNLKSKKTNRKNKDFEMSLSRIKTNNISNNNLKCSIFSNSNINLALQSNQNLALLTKSNSIINQNNININNENDHNDNDKNKDKDNIEKNSSHNNLNKNNLDNVKSQSDKNELVELTKIVNNNHQNDKLISSSRESMSDNKINSDQDLFNKKCEQLNHNNQITKSYSSSNANMITKNTINTKSNSFLFNKKFNLLKKTTDSLPNIGNNIKYNLNINNNNNNNDDDNNRSKNDRTKNLKMSLDLTSKNRIILDLNDDGGVYKGPP